MSALNLLDLYGKYNGDISIETNRLANMNDEDIVRAMQFSYTYEQDRANIRRLRAKGKVYFHKVLKFSSSRERAPEEREGFYEYRSSSDKKFYTSFKAMCNFLLENRIKAKFEVAK